MLPSSWISPTAHYTGHVSWRNGLSHPAFRTGTGRAFFAAIEPLNRLWLIAGGPTLHAMLIARHRVIDHLLETAIAAGEIEQVIEVAAGLSPRGLRFVERHPQLIYVEADLPGMASRKRDVLEEAGSLSARHFDRSSGVAILTEGLVNYCSTDAVEGIWGRCAEALEGFSAGLYLSVITCDDDIVQAAAAGRSGHCSTSSPAANSTAISPTGWPCARHSSAPRFSSPPIFRTSRSVI